MTKTNTVAGWALPWGDDRPENTVETLALTLAWCLEEPGRLGEVARVTRACVLGRDEGKTTEACGFFRERPSGVTGGASIGDGRLSRRQLLLEPVDDHRLRVENIGKCPLLVNGEEATTAVVTSGDVLALKNVAVFHVSRRSGPSQLRNYPASLAFPFGEADTHGIVGESPAIWRLRDEMALAAGSPGHVLVHGASGAGKELVARALHALSSRATRPIVARNAATFPEGLIDAELFGNVKNYPNPGMPERRGLIGDAHESTLFLDEIGELPLSLQAHLLRVLDSGGDYQRLGESRPSKSDLRMIAATNRSLTELKHDFLARFTARIRVPPLAERREDIALLLRYRLELLRREQPATTRFFDPRARDVARIDPTLVEALLRHQYTHELRELERLLWLAITTSPGTFIAYTDAVRAELRLEPASGGAEPAELDRARIEEALQGAGGNVTRAARSLGLKNRFALYRLMKRHGIEAESDDDGEPEPS